MFRDDGQQYTAQVRMAGGVPKYIPLRQTAIVPTESGRFPMANDVFQLDMEELEAIITPQTKLLILNSPHNPTGKMFSRTEMERIADVVRKHPQLTVITDEVSVFWVVHEVVC